MKILNDKEYQEKKNKFIKFCMNFQEVFTANRQYLKIKHNRYYLKEKEEKEKLTGHELSLIAQVSRNVKKRCKNINIPDAEGLPNYILYNMDKSFESKDIYEIDIKSAYLTAAKHRKIITEEEYQKFFEYEKDLKEQRRKLPSNCTGKKCKLCKSGKHVKPQNRSRYICKDTGAVLKYSKDVRLISLGTLASRKEVHTYSAQAKRNIECVQGRIKCTSTKAQHSELINKEIVHNRTEANIFYTCALDIDRVLTQIIKNVPNVYFCWVDAIFCSEQAIQQVIEYLELYQYEYRIQKHSHIKYDANFKEAKVLKDNEISPYKFNLSKHIENVCILNDTATQMQKELSIFNELKQFFDRTGIETEYKYIAQELKMSVKMLKHRLKQTGYKRPLNYALWISAKNTLNITSLKDYNLEYFCKLLNDRKLNYKDFIKIQKMIKEQVSYKDSTLKFATETAVFFENYDREKARAREGKELEAKHSKDIIGESQTTTIEIQNIIDDER